MYALSHPAWPTLCSPMDCTLPGSSAHGLLQARVLEWLAIPGPWIKLGLLHYSRILHRLSHKKYRELVGTKHSWRQAEARAQKVDTYKIWLWEKRILISQSELVWSFCPFIGSFCPFIGMYYSQLMTGTKIMKSPGSSQNDSCLTIVWSLL